MPNCTEAIAKRSFTSWAERRSLGDAPMQSKLLPLTRDVRGALSEHVVFHSPVRDYHGHADVSHILMTIADVLQTVEFERELVAEREVISIITATHADHEMTGILHESHDAHGRIERVTLLLRPLSTLLDAITAMRAALEQSPLPSTLAARSR
jgi:hypothetical protein